MRDLLQLLVSLDHDAIWATRELHWGPATAVFALISTWWVKGPLLVAVGWFADVRGRRLVPLIALAATVSFFVASAVNHVLKDLVARARPPEAIGLDPLVGVPGSPSFPSGHAMSAFATAAVVAVLAPRMRWPVLALAALVGLSRVYLGVHFWLDVLVGSVLGFAIGAACAWPMRGRCCSRHAVAPAA